MKSRIAKEGVYGVSPRREVDGLAPYDKRFNLDKYPESIPDNIMTKARTAYPNQLQGDEKQAAVNAMWKAQKEFQ